MVRPRLALLTLAMSACWAASVWAVEARTTNERSLAQNKPALAQNKAEKTENKPTKSAAKTPAKPPERPPVKVDKATELAATQLVESHLPDLKPVLQHLRSDDPRQYHLALRDLAKSARRLEFSKKRDEVLYDLDVELLQAQSSVRLLTAKLKVRDNPADRKRLRDAVGRLHEAEFRRAKYDVTSLEERIKKTQKSLEVAKQRLASKEKNHDQLVETSYLNYLRKAGRQTDTPQNKKK